MDFFDKLRLIYDGSEKTFMSDLAELISKVPGDENLYLQSKTVIARDNNTSKTMCIVRDGWVGLE